MSDFENMVDENCSIFTTLNTTLHTTTKHRKGFYDSKQPQNHKKKNNDKEGKGGGGSKKLVIPIISISWTLDYYKHGVKFGTEINTA